MQAMAARAGADRSRIEPGSLHQDVSRAFGDPRIPSAHDAGQPQSLAFVGNYQVVCCQHAFAAV